MRAARLHGARDLRLHDEPPPVPGAGAALVRVEAVGLCGSDLHWFEEGAIGGTGIVHALVPGHEFAGRTGDGRLVAVDPAIHCGRCRLCREGHPNLCPEVRFAGHGSVDGALREWLAWPEHNLVPLPEGYTAADGAMLEPLGVAIHAVDLAHLRTGDSVGVFGCGPIGLFCLQVARAAGAARLLATDLPSRPHRLQAARAAGATVFAAEAGSEAEAVARAAGGLGLDVAIECAGSQAAVDAAVESVRPGARVVLAGIPSDERTSIRAAAARRKGLTVAFSRRMKQVYPRAIALVDAGRVDLRSVVSHRLPLSEAARAFELAASREGLKVIVEP
ncbi:MAG TPA: alcohol dehydrogenase catalytic domain-containing protein [Vicinamibacteria bacterium]|nr:alcohol dehydrogenase catalytic domain-containing protein [Vicinamibacteria bacterium]